MNVPHNDNTIGPENLNERAKRFAVYIPSVQLGSAKRLCDTNEKMRKGGLPANLNAIDLNFLEPDNRFWHYNYALATAAHFKGEKRDNIINTAHESVTIMGDSAGYQIGHGTMDGIKSWKRYSDDDARIMDLWRKSSMRNEILEWQKSCSSLALTIDMPIWAIGNEGSPFRNLSAEQLTELSVENLRYLESQREIFGTTKFLNVLQGSTVEEEEAWFQAVKHVPLHGWSLAGNVGQMGGISRVLRRVLLLREENLLDSPYDWLHILRLSRVRWAPIMTALQQAVRRTTGNKAFTVSYDSSSPYRIGGMTTQYAVLGRLGKTLEDGWSISAHPFPTGYGMANEANPIPLKVAKAGALPYALQSPIASMLTVQDLNPRTGEMDIRTLDGFSDEVLINHNVYTYVMANIRANEVVFDTPEEAPQQLLDAVGAVDEIFAAERWQDALSKHARLLGSVVGDSEENDYKDPKTYDDKKC